MQGLDRDRRPQHQLRIAELTDLVDVEAVALEALVGIDPDHHIEVPRRTAAPPVLALAAQSQAGATLDFPDFQPSAGYPAHDAVGDEAPRAMRVGSIIPGTAIIDEQPVLSCHG